MPLAKLFPEIKSVVKYSLLYPVCGIGPKVVKKLFSTLKSFREALFSAPAGKVLNWLFPNDRTLKALVLAVISSGIEANKLFLRSKVLSPESTSKVFG